MKLRTQLLLIACLIAILPFLLWIYLTDMGGILRKNSIESLQDRAQLISHLIAASKLDALALDPVDLTVDLFVGDSPRTIVMDGYADDWSGLSVVSQKFSAVEGDEVVLRSVSRGTYLYLFFEVIDNQTVFHNPNSGTIASGDRLLLYFDSGAESNRQYLLRAIAPGSINTLHEISVDKGIKQYVTDPNISAYWQPTASGYSIEVKIPLLDEQSKFGFTIIDRDHPGVNGDSSWIGSVDPEQGAVTGRILHSPEMLKKLMKDVTKKGSRIRLFDRNGQLLVDLNKLDKAERLEQLINPRLSPFIDVLLYRIFNYWLLEKYSKNSKASYKITNDGQNLLQNVVSNAIDTASGHISYVGRVEPVVMNNRSVAFILLEVKTESVTAVVSSALVNMLGGMLLLVFCVIFALILYASWLSFRIQKISSATAIAVRSDGEILTTIPSSRASDELGDLSRNISHILENLSSYTRYLRSLASKLSHELRTPLAVVSTSLENLSGEQFSEQNKVLLERANKGANRLQGLIRALSEATTLEQIVQNPNFESINVVDWLKSVTSIYQDLYQSHHIRFVNNSKHETIIINAAPDLLQQLLDKLMSNANDFSNEGGVIEISIQMAADKISLSVFNEGDAIDHSIQTNLFDALVSYRVEQDKNPHLGMGLHIVKLIATAHCATVDAHYISARKGVKFSINF